MNQQDIKRYLDRYLAASSRKDTISQKVRLSELEPSSLKYLESRISISNSKEIHRVEKILIELNLRINRLENPDVFVERVSSIVLKQIVATIAIISGIATCVALIMALLKI